jgi:uncharacterized Zn-binding protein involved in type VI secretion
MQKYLATMVLGGCLALGVASAAMAEEPADALPPAAPGVITEGSGDVSVGSLPAARKGDAASDGAAIEQGSSNVFINGKPAVTVGDKTGCGGTTVSGASNVFVNGKPLARAGDLTTGCAGQ